MCRNLKTLSLLILMLALAATVAQAGNNKIEICHFPPGNQDNFHTITISENAWTAHQVNHGDLLGSCLDNCETICGDGDACTQDIQSDPDECICLPDHPPVDCDDSLACTADSCDPATGCLYVENCADGNECTADICPDVAPGNCQYPPVTDGTACTTETGGAGECQSGVCAGTPAVCDSSRYPSGLAIPLPGQPDPLIWYSPDGGLEDCHPCDWTDVNPCNDGECQWFNIADAAGYCYCPPPNADPFCGDCGCQNGGIPLLCQPPAIICNCPPEWTGAFCEIPNI